MDNKKAVIPGIFTTLNLFCGFLALVKILDDKVIHACWLIIIAAIFDLLDGQIARLTKSASSFGVEFDSLADVVSFGVAPSILLYHVYFINFGIVGMIISFSPLIAGAFRLARFNVQLTGFQKSRFYGFPIPIAAISFVSFIIFNFQFWNEIYLTRLLIPQLAFICILMISTVEYYTLPKFSFKLGRNHSSFLIVIMITSLILIAFPHETLYPICMCYALWGVIRSFFHFNRVLKQRKKDKHVV